MNRKTRILFMCVANSARSQLAEGLAHRIFGSDAEIQSAGSNPSKVNEFAVRVLKEVGIDISSQFSKSIEAISPEFLESLDYVITLCVEEVCPILITKAKRLHWPLLDPASSKGSDEDRLNSFRQVRDELERRIRQLFQQLNLE